MQRGARAILAVQQNWVQVQALEFTSCETSGKLFNLSEPLFICFKNKNQQYSGLWKD